MACYWQRLVSIFGALVGVIFATTGCGEFHYLTGTSEGSSYLLRLGGPREIVDWTLKQEDENAIADGIAAMALFCGPNDCRCAAAIAGIRKIHLKLTEGWPGFTGINRARGDPDEPLPETRRQENFEHLFEVVYRELLFIGSPEAKEAYLSLRPNQEQNPERFQRWYDIGTLYHLPR
jgi:hypothetical protein